MQDVEESTFSVQYAVDVPPLLNGGLSNLPALGEVRLPNLHDAIVSLPSTGQVSSSESSEVLEPVEV